MSIKYTAAILPLLLQLGSVVRAADKPAAETINTSPVISSSMFGYGVSSNPVTYKKSMLVVSSKDGVAVIAFDKPIPNGVT